MTNGDGNIYSKDGTTLRYVPKGATSLIIPADVTRIANYAAYECQNLISVCIPDNVTSIVGSAVRSCHNLKTVTIGRGVTSIGSDAFYDCTSTTDVFCYADPSVLTWNDSGFDEFMGRDKQTVCHVDAAALADYKAKWETGDESTDVSVDFQGDLLPQLAAKDFDGTRLRTYFNSTDNVKVPAGVSVFKVSQNGTTLTATEVEDGIILAGQGVVLKSETETIALASTTASSSADYSDNVLEGVDAATSKEAGHRYYTLSQSKGTLGFFEYTDNVLPAHEAFIKTTTGTAGGYAFDSATGIRDVTGPTGSDDLLFNLSGQRLRKLLPGINIKGGRKVLVK